MFFFFFKQKTAYELRISDWSSDVCSSDLAERHLGEADPRIRGGDAHVAGERELEAAAERRAVQRRDERLVRSDDRRDNRRHLRLGERQIGRAAGRERVCQYV